MDEQAQAQAHTMVAVLQAGWEEGGAGVLGGGGGSAAGWCTAQPASYAAAPPPPPQMKGCEAYDALCAPGTAVQQCLVPGTAPNVLTTFASKEAVDVRGLVGAHEGRSAGAAALDRGQDPACHASAEAAALLLACRHMPASPSPCSCLPCLPACRACAQATRWMGKRAGGSCCGCHVRLAHAHVQLVHAAGTCRCMHCCRAACSPRPGCPSPLLCP